MRITDTVEINESSPIYYGTMNTLQNAVFPAGGEGGAATPLVAGDLDVTMRVNITCTY